jgi:PAS domain S-box-containing protein
LGPYVFVNNALAGFFAAAALIGAAIWRGSPNNARYAWFAAHCSLAAAFCPVLAEMASAATVERAQAAVDARITLGLLWGMTLTPLLSAVSGLRAPVLTPAVGALGAAAAVVNAFWFPFAGRVTSLESLTMPWGEEIAFPVQERPSWAVGLLYLPLTASAVFGLRAAAAMSPRDRLAGGLAGVGAVGLLAAIALAAGRDLAGLRVPYIAAFPDAAFAAAFSVAIWRDLVRRGERAAAAESRLREISDLIPGLLYRYRLRPDGRDCFDSVTAGAERVFGVPAAAVLADSMAVWGRIHPDDAPALRVSIAESAATGCHWRGTFRIRRDDGTFRWLRAESFPEPPEPDGARVWNGVVVDVTEAKEAEEALRESEGRFRALIEDLEVGVVLQDADDRVLLSNRAARAMLGVTEDSLHGTTSRDPRWRVVRDDGSDLPAGEVPSVVAARSLRPVRGVVLGVARPDSGERRWLEVAAVPRLDADGSLRHVLVTFIDITDRRRAERQRAEFEEALRRSQKLEAIGHLAAGVAHDFNNLLTAIGGWSDVLEAGIGPSGDGTAAAAVRAIREAGDRGAALTRQLLAFGRREMVQSAAADANAVVARTRGILERLLGEDIECVVVPSPGPCPVKADPGQIGQVVMNMAVNARDAMPRGGRLTIAVDRLAVAGPSPDFPEIRPGPYVRIAITDTGCGMDAATKARIFEPFFTTKGPDRGTGLGLFTAYGIVRRFGGHIAVDSRPGEGTTFRILLPAAEEGSAETAAASMSAARAPVPPAAARAATILLVEDDPGVRGLAETVLSARGHRVIAAADGRAGLEAFRSAAAAGTAVDLLVTDVVMPGMGGRELAEELRDRRPGLKLLFMSGYTDDAVLRHGIRHDRVAFLPKPFTADAVSRVLSGGRVESPPGVVPSLDTRRGDR